MFFPENRVKVFVYGRPTDMRKSFQGLYALTKNVLQEDPLSGHVFVFINRRGNYMKIFYYDRHGYCIWSKRLEQGRFQWWGGDKQCIDWVELKCLLDGLDVRDVKRYKRYHHDTNPCMPALKSV